MTKSKYRLVVATLVLFSLFATACFQIIGFKLKKPSLAVGQNNQIIVDMGRLASTHDATAYAFILVGVGESLDLSGASKFDFKENFGGKFDSVSDNALRNFLLTGDNCGVAGFTAGDVEASFATWRAYRSTVKIDSADGAFGDINRVKVKVQRNGGENSASGEYIIFSGGWIDTNNDQVIAGLEYACTGVIGGAIPFKP